MTHAKGRTLPSRTNPLMVESVPEYAELVARRRLTQTELTQKITGGADSESGTTGALDYAHLRAPLPKGIVSGVFKVNPSPASYFLMRRSFDGYVSATGMFKATFPYAEAAEEEAERQYIKSLPNTDPEELAGSIWIPPEQALALADEYKIGTWIQALLDPAKITVSSSSSAPSKRILAPPKFELSKIQKDFVPLTPSSIPRSTRGRRSVSPVKTTRRTAPQPRKRTVKAKAEVVETKVNGEETKTQTDDATLEATSFDPDIVLEHKEAQPDFKVGADDASTAISESDELLMDMAGKPPSADEIAKMMQVAADMVRQDRVAAEKAVQDEESDGGKAKPIVKKSKRKAADITKSEQDANNEAADATVEREVQVRAKRARTEVERQRNRVKQRALVGLSATVAVG
ncbi:hypothetical protein CDD80_4202 [Ophiocordyceps camponoti-rufipedis]|uniref:HTH APSES-type domain-containing protein n=1 Tax=Ophiocordyceps camponoti-rufipedis TaxID=2004952 RepID=A0A2C5Z124_9HYPO|nr:hypothetical protein CDD80_4202 [Ophiocordyceps camponoti-rufipedis]